MNKSLSLATKFLDLDPFDIMYRDLFDSDSFFEGMLNNVKINYPVDIKETEKALEIDIAAVDVNKEDIDIEVDDDVLKVSYNKKEKDSQENENYIYRGITRRSFNMAWRIASKFDLSKLEAKLEKGLLKIRIPVSDKKVVKKIEVK